jgi:hypothetical protein
LKPPGFNPSAYEVKTRFQSLLFQIQLVRTAIQLVPLRNGPLYVGKDMSQPGVRGFVSSVQLHAFALEDADVQQVGLALPGVRLVTWTLPAVINWYFYCKIM